MLEFQMYWCIVFMNQNINTILQYAKYAKRCYTKIINSTMSNKYD